MRERADANVLLAFYQALNRVSERLSPETCEALLDALDKRPDSIEKFHLFHAVGLLAGAIADDLFAEFGHQGAYLARYWTTEANLRASGVWRRLYGGAEVWGAPRMPSVNDHSVLADLVDDAELMGILGLQPGWTPDLKQIDPDLDLKATDLDEGLS
jgi:hypothetical protein